LAQGNSVRAAG